MKKTLVALLILAMLLSLAACSTTKQTPEAATPSTDNSAAEQTETKDESSEKIWKVGIALQVSGDHQANIVNALKEGLDKESNIQYEVVDHEANVTKEISQIEDFIAKKMDIICLTPVDAEALVDVVNQANEAGIQVIEFDMKTNGGDYIFVGANDNESAELQADYLAEVLPENAKCCILLGILGHSGQILRSEGIKKLYELRPDVEILAEESGEWSTEKGMTITENLLQKYPDLDAIISQNDNMALGAIEAIAGAGKTGDVIVVGVDAIPDAIQAVKDGTMAMTVLNDGQSMGRTMYDVILKLIAGEPVEKEYIIPYKAITPDNVDEYLN